MIESARYIIPSDDDYPFVKKITTNHNNALDSVTTGPAVRRGLAGLGDGRAGGAG